METNFFLLWIKNEMCTVFLVHAVIVCFTICQGLPPHPHLHSDLHMQLQLASVYGSPHPPPTILDYAVILRLVYVEALSTTPPGVRVHNKLYFMTRPPLWTHPPIFWRPLCLIIVCDLILTFYSILVIIQVLNISSALVDYASVQWMLVILVLTPVKLPSMANLPRWILL